MAGVARFVRDPERLVIVPPEDGGNPCEIVLPTGAVRLGGVPESSARHLEAIPWPGGAGRGRPAARLAVVPVEAGWFRRAGEIDWDPFLAVEHRDDAVLVAGYRWMLRLERRDPPAGALWLDRTAAGSDLEDLWENVLRIVAAYGALAAGGLLLHSAAVVVGGAGFLLPGASGDGKSTVAALCGREGALVLSDDCNAVLPGGRGFEVAGLPFGGDRRPRACPAGRYPLAGILGLEKGEETALEAEDPAAVAARLVAAAPFVNGDPAVGTTVLARASGIAACVPVGRLRFALSGGVVAALDGAARRGTAV